MSYDIHLSVKTETGQFIKVATPVYDSPTYNLRNMFVNCMDWDYNMHDAYKCDEVLIYVNRGIYELTFNRKEYEKYNPPNGWGDLDGALRVLQSLKGCIDITSEDLEIEPRYLYMSWGY